MARGERIAMVTVALLLFGLSALVNGADAAENLFPVFPTYPVDGNMEDEARYGVISVNDFFVFIFWNSISSQLLWRWQKDTQLHFKNNFKTIHNV